ncbi:MAG TPA: hypothetical protein VHX38_35475 [Pseudonocardiaceae bacterium]|nr:hypothetical protein [Pseudonocardiaceae bacterium]
MTVTATQPAPRSTAASDWLRELVDVRNEYEELLCWPVLLEVTNRRLIMPTGTTLDAVVMPAALGEKVLAELRIAMLDCPVIMEPDGSWIFATDPVGAPHPAMPPELISAQVRTLPAGSQVVLPASPHLCGVGRSWVTPCRRQSLAPWHAVIATGRRIIARGFDGNLSYKADVPALYRPAAA